MKWLRAGSSAIVGVIAVVGLLLSAIGFWVRETVFDETEVSSAVEAALDEPGVTDALAVRLTERVMDAVDLESIVNGVLPPPLQRLTPAIVGGATQLVEKELTEVLEDPDVQQAMISIFERGYVAFLDVLKGEGLVDGVTVEAGELTVNFLPVIAQGLQILQRFGLASGVTIPELTRDGDPSEQIQQLEQALDRDLPDDFGQIVVYRSDSLAQVGETVERAQQLLVTVYRAFWLILALTAIAIAGTLLLANKRRRAILILLLSTAALFVVARVVVKKVLDEAPSVARTPAGETAMSALLRSLADGLVAGLGVIAILAVVAAIGVYASDPNSAVYRKVAGTSGDVGFGAVVAANRVPVAIVAFAAAVLVLVLAGFHVLSVIVIVALAAVGIYALTVTPTTPAPEAPTEAPG